MSVPLTSTLPVFAGWRHVMATVTGVIWPAVTEKLDAPLHEVLASVELPASAIV